MWQGDDSTRIDTRSIINVDKKICEQCSNIRNIINVLRAVMEGKKNPYTGQSFKKNNLHPDSEQTHNTCFYILSVKICSSSLRSFNSFRYFTTHSSDNVSPTWLYIHPRFPSRADPAFQWWALLSVRSERNVSGSELEEEPPLMNSKDRWGSPLPSRLPRLD